MSGKAVLIVEDNREINNMLAAFLRDSGWETVCAYNGLEAAANLKNREFAVVLMDLMLPYVGGGDLLIELRTRLDTPVICLSAKSDVETRLEMLRMGADDYILKPFDLDEVLVRMEVVLRRGRAKTGEAGRLEIFNLTMDTVNACAVVKGVPLKLTAKEFALLQLFLENPRKTFSKANLYEAVWQAPYFYEDNTLNVHMSNLRNKLKKADSENEYIETVWGIGYRLAVGENIKKAPAG